MFLDMSVHITLIFEMFAAVQVGAVGKPVSLILTLKWKVFTTDVAYKWTSFVFILVSC